VAPALSPFETGVPAVPNPNVPDTGPATFDQRFDAVRVAMSRAATAAFRASLVLPRRDFTGGFEMVTLVFTKGLPDLTACAKSTETLLAWSRRNVKLLVSTLRLSDAIARAAPTAYAKKRTSPSARADPFMGTGTGLTL